jgi:hypothetical protein
MLGARAILTSTYIPNVSFFTDKISTATTSNRVDALYIENESTTLNPTIWFSRIYDKDKKYYISWVRTNNSRFNNTNNYLLQTNSDASRRSMAINNNKEIYFANGRTATGANILKITRGGSQFNTGALVFTLGGTRQGYSNSITDPRFSYPSGIATDSNNNVYITDTENHVIRKLTPKYSGVDVENYQQNYITSTLAGPHDNHTLALNTKKGCIDGARSAARFHNPQAICVDLDDNIYVTDNANSTIRKITPYGLTITIAGLSGVTGNTNGIGSAARFSNPSGICCDFEGNIYVSDSGNRIIRKITKSPLTTPIAKTYLDFDEIERFASLNTNFRFGEAISISNDGNVVAIGAPFFSTTTSRVDETGRVSIYRKNNLPSNFLYTGVQSINGGSVFDRFASSVSLNFNGNRFVVGSPNDDGPTVGDSGSVSVYNWNANTGQYTQIGQTILSLNNAERFGSSVSMNSAGDIFAVSTPFTNATIFKGSVRVYNWNENTTQWTQMGQTLSGANDSDRFGGTVSINSTGNIFATNSRSGVIVYQWNPNTSQWGQLGQTIFYGAFDLSDNVRLNSNGNFLVIGFINSITNGGVRVYNWNSNLSRWDQLGSDITAPNAAASFGFRVAINNNGNKIAVSSPNSDIDAQNTGSVIFYNWDSSTSQWIQTGRIDGDFQDDKLGHQIAMDGSGDLLLTNLAADTSPNAFGYDYVKLYENKTISYTEQYEYNVTTFAGSGDFGDTEGDYLVARFSQLQDIKMMNSGDLIVIDGAVPRMKRIKNPIIPITNFNITISSNHYNLDLGYLLRKRGWNGIDDVNCTLTILSGVYIYSAIHALHKSNVDLGIPGMAQPALTIEEKLNNSTITIVNSGSIIGAGGKANLTDSFVSSLSVSRYNGSDAILTRANITLKNYGIIGGGGGAGGSVYDISVFGNLEIWGSGGGGAGYLAGRNGILSKRPSSQIITIGEILSGRPGTYVKNISNTTETFGGTGGDLGQNGLTNASFIKATNDSRNYFIAPPTNSGASINGISFVTIDPSSTGQLYGPTI